MQHLVMKIALEMMKIICLLFLPTSTCNKKKKINELIGAIHEKDELLDSQEEFVIKENKKHVKVKNAYAQEVEKCDKLTSELRLLRLRNQIFVMILLSTLKMIMLVLGVCFVAEDPKRKRTPSADPLRSSAEAITYKASAQ
jgi:hypothetical protein